MNTFGKVKMETLKKYIKKQEKARSPEQANRRDQNKSPELASKNEREEQR